MGKTLEKIPRSLIFVTFFGLILRLINLSQSFWLDEASQAVMSSAAVFEIWFNRSGDFHPPLFYLLGHFWIKLGHSEVWLRSLPLIFGVLAIPLTYIFGKKILPVRSISFHKFSISPAILAAFFIAVNPFHIYYSQEFRSYSLLAFLGLWSMHLLFSRQYFFLSIINALLMYTHYSSAFLLVAQLTYVIFYNKKDLRPFLFNSIFTLLLYTPWIPQLTSQLASGTNIDVYLPGWKSVLSVSTFKIVPLTFFKLVAGRINFLSGYVYYPYIVFVLACVFASFRLAKNNRDFLLNWTLVPVFSMIMFSFVFPQNQPFRVIYILPGLTYLFVTACIRFPKLFITLFVYIFFIGNLSYYSRPRLQREQWRQAITFLQSTATDTSAIVVKFSDKFSPFYWYIPELTVLPGVPHYPSRPEEVSAALIPLRSSPVNEVYVLDYLGELTDPHREVDQILLDTGYIKSATFNFEGVGLVHQFFKP